MIRVQDVSVVLGAHRILDGVNLELRPREATVLIGSNGAGKSTLMRVMAAAQPIANGSVTWNGESDFSPRSRWRRELGFIPQSAQLVTGLSALSNVIHGFAGSPHDWRCCVHWLAPDWMRRRAMQALADVGMEDKALQTADSLSGGEAQRCAIARALVRRPHLVLADEPTASLDPRTRDEIHELLLHIVAERQATLVVATHIVEEALPQFQRVVALRSGRILFDRRTSEVSHDDLRAVYAQSDTTSRLGAASNG